MTRGSDFIYRRNLLKRYGWTETTIKRFLPEPDRKKKSKSTGNYSYLYRMSRVLEIESKEEFQAWALQYQGPASEYQRPPKLSKEEKKSQKLKAEKQLEDEILKLASEVEVSLPYLEEENFYSDLVQRYNNHLNYLYAIGVRVDREDLDLETDSLRKISGCLVEFLREDIAVYSEPFSSIQKKIGRKKSLDAVEEKALSAIGNSYPWLKPTVERQLRAIQNSKVKR